MSLNYSSVRFMENGENVTEDVLNRAIRDLAEAINAQILNETETKALDWDASHVSSGVLDRSRVSNISGSNLSEQDLVPVLSFGGNAFGNWTSFQDLLDKYANQIGGSGYAWQGNVYTSPTANNNGRQQGLQIVAATHTNAPVGMMVGYRTSYTNSWYIGNGTATASRTGTFLAFKVLSNQWYAIDLDAPTQ